MICCMPKVGRIRYIDCLYLFRNVDALKYVLTNAPLGSKQQAAKGTNTFCPWIGGYIYSFKKAYIPLQYCILI
jgi:hypothetical protein